MVSDVEQPSNEQKVMFFKEGEDPQEYNRLVLEVSEGELKKNEDITKFISSLSNKDALAFPFILDDNLDIIINFGWYDGDYRVELVDVECQARKSFRVKINMTKLISKQVGDYSMMGLGMQVMRGISFKTFHEKCGRKPKVEVRWER